MADITIYPARVVRTMNPAHPTAAAVAVRGDLVLGVGTVDELATWGDHIIDPSFSDQVLLPGFVEAHSHSMAGGMWQFTYVGFFDRRDPNGKVWPGCKSTADVLERLREAEAALTDPADQLIAWGLDPIYLPGERLVAAHLDTVSEHRSIFVYHASGHLATANTALLRLSEITADSTTPGVVLGADGQPNGELQEPAAMSLAASAWRTMGRAFGSTEAKWAFAAEARNAGHTLVTDLGTSPLNNDRAVDNWFDTVNDPDFPARVMVAVGNAFGGGADPGELARLALDLRDRSTDKLHFGIVKLILDGSIQGFTARISWPHYYTAPDGHPEGV